MTLSAKAKNRVTNNLRKYQNALRKAAEYDINESDTVTIIADILCDIFGFDKYENVTSEFAIRKTYCDLAIKIENKVPLLIECKAIGVDLKDDHVRQATNYAAESGSELAILTNGRLWKVYHIIFKQPIEKQLIYEFDFLELSAKKADTLDVLTPLCVEMFPKGRAIGLIDYYDQIKVFNKYVIGQVIFSDEVVLTIKRRMKRLFPNVKVEQNDIKKILVSEIVKRDIVEGESFEEAQKLVKKAERTTAKKQNKEKPVEE